MKGFERSNQLFSLCGLNCGLCSMHLGGHCPGCGGGSGNQSCKIARCSLEHGKIEYCCECGEYPCSHYELIDSFDSFITHRHQKEDLRKAMRIGIENYNAEQKEKAEILRILLSDYNDGRRKSFYCAAVNLLDLTDIKNIMKQITENGTSAGLTVKERCSYAAGLFERTAREKNIELKLRKKVK